MSERIIRLSQVQNSANINLSTMLANTVYLMVTCSDASTALTAAANVAYIRAPRAFTINSVSASLANTSGSGNVTVAIQKNGTQVLSTNMNVDTLSTTSIGGNTPGVIGVSSVAFNDLLQFQIVNAGTGAQGLIVTINGYAYASP